MDHPGAVLVGSTFDMIDSEGRVFQRAQPERIAGPSAPFAHPSIMYRREMFTRVGGYRRGTDYFEDADLYRRLAVAGDILVISKPLIGVRFAGQNARLRDTAVSVLETVNPQFDASPPSSSTAPTLHPMSLYAIAVLAILAERRPGLLRIMLQRMSFSRVLPALAVMTMIGTAELSPSAARWVLRTVSAVKNRARGGDYIDGEVYVWRPDLRYRDESIADAIPEARLDTSARPRPS